MRNLVKLTRTKFKQLWVLKYFYWDGGKDYRYPSSLGLVKSRIEDDYFHNIACVILYKRKSTSENILVIKAQTKEEFLGEFSKFMEDQAKYLEVGI